VTGDYWDSLHPEPPDPVVQEAILNIKMAIRNIAPLLGTTYETPELNNAMADLEQAVRYLEGKEEPS
jgi:hypothetical protein